MPTSRRGGCAVTLLAISIVAYAFPSRAGEGDLDVGFGVQGLLAPIDPGTAQPLDAINALVPTGTAVAGLVETRGQNGIVLFDADGAIDAAFGDTGVALLGTAPGSLHVLADGSFLVVGSAGPGILRLTRVTTAGVLDATFGTGGVVETPGVSTLVRGVGEQPDGKVVVNLFDPDDVVLVRYETDGDLDATFGTGGILETSVGANVDWIFMVMQGDGKMVVVGIDDDGLALARFDANGSLDATYGTGGIVTEAVPFLVAPFAAQGIQVRSQPDDSVLVLGWQTHGGDLSNHAVFRFSDTGARDPSFGIGGALESSLFHAPMGLSTLLDGRILLRGSPANVSGTAIERYDADGQLDLTFGPCAAAFVLTGVGPVAELPDGRFLGIADDQLLRIGTPDPLPTCIGAPERKSTVKYLPVLNTFNGKFIWKWKNDAIVQTEDFGDPLTDTHYLMCAFQEGGPRLGAFRVEGGLGGGQCPPSPATGPCWKEQARGFKLTRKDQFGVLTMKLLAGEAGRAKIVVKSKSGTTAGRPAYDLPVRVRMLRMDGHACCQACWEAVFSEATANLTGDGLLYEGPPAGGKFVAKSD